MHKMNLQFFAKGTAEAPKRANIIPLIDVNMVVFETAEDAWAVETASQIQVEPILNTTDAIQLIVKDKLIAQKGQKNTLTGHTITLTDSVFSPEMVVCIQGGDIEYNEMDYTKVKKYTPPNSGEALTMKPFTVHTYSAQYDSSGQIVQYEHVMYPNCQGTPIGLNRQDNTFSTPEYTITSYPSNGKPPYTIEYVEALPVMVDNAAVGE